MCFRGPNMLLSAQRISRSKRRLPWRASCSWRKREQVTNAFSFYPSGRILKKRFQLKNSLLQPRLISPLLMWQSWLLPEATASSFSPEGLCQHNLERSLRPRKPGERETQTLQLPLMLSWNRPSVFSVCSHNRDYFPQEPQEGVFLLLCKWLCHRGDNILMFLFCNDKANY